MENITKIVLTGGPCAGKTTALVRIIEHFTGLGYQVFTLPETPTMFTQAGINFLTKNRQLHYEAEKALLRIQLQLEDRFAEMATKCDKPVLIVCDRGTMDISCYLSEEAWEAIMIETGVNTIGLRDSRYDAVLHLVTAANVAEQFYTVSNNSARTETVQQARWLDKAVIEAWTGHPHLRIINNTVDFEEKIRRVIAEISRIIGAPQPIDAERKYVVEVTGEIPGAIENEIIQTYLLSEPTQEIRLRKRGSQGNYVYFQTVKKPAGTPDECIETERQISPRQYVMLLQQADPDRKPIHKIRKNFVWEKQYFELDTYLEPAIGLNILEIEGVKDHDDIEFPPFIKIIEDVTGREEYFNYNMAKF
ncbi:MAG: AAA family ATPase [Prevotella sp.]|nr:AAA family ATPase [Prevotella sp.]